MFGPLLFWQSQNLSPEETKVETRMKSKERERVVKSQK